MQIGRYAIPGGVVVAPMAGVTDRVFRRLWRARFNAIETASGRFAWIGDFLVRLAGRGVRHASRAAQAA